MSLQRIAVIFSDRERPETTGVYVRKAFQELLNVDHVQSGEVENLKGDYDLFVQIDDGYDYVLPETCRPSVFWAIDTHMNLERYHRVGHQYDLVFTAQRDGAEQLIKAGISAEWLPLACDPSIHRQHDLAKVHELCFIGNLVSGARANLIHFLKQRYPSMLIDQRYFDEMARAYSASKIVFNRSIKNDINMRVFEAAACGSLLLTNDLRSNGLGELFQDGVHLALYDSPEELVDKLQYYLTHDESREKIAREGMEHAHAKHTYRHRVETMLQRANAITSRKTVSVSSSGGYASDPLYYGYVRPEILDLVPHDARRILDVGCGAGRLGEVLKQRQGAVVVGVEATAAASQHAKCRLDRLYQDDIETLSLDEESLFDAIVCADVLEHLKDPLSVLRKLHTRLAAQGTLIVSLPNIRHHSVVRGLLDGHWTYESAGLLDETHLRFFTRREMEKLLFRAGFQITQRQITPGAEYAQWLQQGRPGEIRLGRLHIGGMSPSEAEEFHVYQYLFTAIPQQVKLRGKVSIILVTHNGLTDTRECLSSLKQLTEGIPFELICVDNGSTDGTPDYLESLAETRVIRNTANRGFPAAVNQGMELASGDYVLLLNNDTVLTTGWLNRLVDAMESDSRVGLVGPMSNCAPGAQRVWDVSYVSDLIGMDGFAWDMSQQHLGNREEVASLSGFCLLIRKEVIDQIGQLDERYGLGTREDDDFCLRARQQGWKCIVARDVYIHHQGHQTFRTLGIDFDKLAEHNQEKFTQKWFTISEKVPAGLTSIIIPVHGQLQHTQNCLQSIREHTPLPYECIIIDNDSPEDMKSWLRQQPDVRVITNDSNRGFPAAVNQGLQAATGDFLLVLNNDTVVTAQWLERLLVALSREPTTGIVGPCTNRISGEQEVPVNYHQETLEGLTGFASAWSLEHHGQFQETDRIVGFCMLMKRSVFERVGLFDERFGLGNFEDDDYCLRAHQAGFRLLIARDVLIHHVAHATFRSTGIDYGSLLKHNQEIFYQKWQPTHHIPITPVSYTLSSNKDVPPLLLQRKLIRLSLCMIVRNNASCIVECLTSIRPYVDEMIVIDTGSTDNTAELARSVGARVYHFPWCDSFSAARNESLKYAQGEWIFWMDSDDVISSECGNKLRCLAYQEHPAEQMGFLVQVHCIGSGPEGHHDKTMVDHVKLFRNSPHIRFEFRMHEQIIGSIRRLGGEIAMTDIYVTHANYDHTPEGQKHKLARDLKLLHLDEQEHPEHTFVLFNLGMTYEGHEPVKAIDYLERSLVAAGSGDSHVRKAYAFLVSAYARLNELDRAIEAVERGLKIFPLDPELQFRRANLLLDSGKVDEAIAMLHQLLEKPEPRHITSVQQGISGHYARSQLAHSYSSQGRHGEALVHWIQVNLEAPWFRTGWRGRIDTMLSQGHYQQAAELIQASAALEQLPGEKELLLGLVHVAIQDMPRAGYWFQQALAFQPGDEVILERSARFFFEHGHAKDAQPLLEQLLQVSPKNAAAYHNLGTVHLNAKDYSQAAECFRKSAEIRPKSRSTWQLLSVSLEKLGDLEGSAEAHRQAQQLPESE